MVDDGPWRVAHIIPSLEVGGAERLLLALVDAGGPCFRHEVVALGADGPIGEALRGLDVPVRILGATGLASAPRTTRILVRHLRQSRPHLVHTWMVHANALGGAAARAAGCRTLWSLHHSDLPWRAAGAATSGLERVNPVLSRLLADAVVSTSASTVPRHVRRGYRRDRLVVVPNAFTSDGGSRPEAARALRHELGLADDVLLIGRIGRFAPQKDWAGFIVAAGDVARGRPASHVVGVGRGIDPGNEELRRWLSQAGIDDRSSLLGERPDATRIAAGLDVLVSSSAFGETTPLVIGEALLAGTPVVVTDVGDSAALTGPGGLVVPPRDPASLAAAVAQLLDAPETERRRIGQAGQEHVQRYGGPRRLADDYERVYRQLIGAAGPSRRRW